MTGRLSRKREEKERAEPARGRALAAALALATALLAWPPAAVEGLAAPGEPAPAPKTTKKAKTKARGAGAAAVASPPAVPAPDPTPAEVAIDAAMAQLGKPYRWAGSGPSSFDCSGLVRFAYGLAGVALPHNSRAQYNQVQRIPLAELAPGDLVFSGGRSIHHVGIYLGDGKMVHSPQSGRRVEVAPLRGNLIGAGRPA